MKRCPQIPDAKYAKRTIACLALLLFTCGAQGALVKWVDAKGKVHYSDQAPPPDVNAQVLVVPLSAKGMSGSASGVSAQKSFVERETERKKELKAKEEAEQKSTQKQQSALTKQKNCTSAKANLKALESNSPLATYNESGESTPMDEATRRQNIEEAQKQINSYCE